MTDRNEVANHEKLIEEAELALVEAVKGSARIEDWAAAVWAVFEKELGEATVTPTAHEVTTAEREALVSVIADARSGDDFDLGEFIGDRPLADRIFSAGFRLTETPEPSAPMSLADDPMRKPFLKKRAEPQGEPSSEVPESSAEDFEGILDRATLDEYLRVDPEETYERLVVKANALASTVRRLLATSVPPQGEPSDAVANAVARAIIEHDEDRLTCYDHPEDFCCPCGQHGMSRSEWQRHRARAALRAANEVR